MGGRVYTSSPVAPAMRKILLMNHVCLFKMSDARLFCNLASSFQGLGYKTPT